MILSAVSFPATARADTPIVEYVDCDITENTTWHAGDYYICKTGDNDEPKITNGATLTIKSGARSISVHAPLRRFLVMKVS